MTKDQKIRAAASALGKLARGIPKRLTDAQREAKRLWGPELTARRLAKRAAAAGLLSRFVVVDAAGQEWPYSAETADHAVTLARHDGINAVSARAATQETKGEQ